MWRQVGHRKKGVWFLTFGVLVMLGSWGACAFNGGTQGTGDLERRGGWQGRRVVEKDGTWLVRSLGGTVSQVQASLHRVTDLSEGRGAPTIGAGVGGLAVHADRIYVTLLLHSDVPADRVEARA